MIVWARSVEVRHCAFYVRNDTNSLIYQGRRVLEHLQSTSQELSLTRKRPPLYNINHRSEESPTAARHGVVPDIQAAGSDWDIDVGSSVVTVLGTDQILQI